MSGRGGRGGRYRQRNAAAAANASFFSVLAPLLPPPVRKALQKPAAPAVALVALVALVDVAVSASLFTAVMAKTGSRPFFRSLTDFRRSAADVLLLCLFRTIALASLSYAAAAMQSKSASSSSPAGFVELREPTADAEAGTAREEGKHDARRRLALRLTAQAVCAASQVLLGAKAVALPPMSGDALRLVVLVVLASTRKRQLQAPQRRCSPPLQPMRMRQRRLLGLGVAGVVQPRRLPARRVPASCPMPGVPSRSVPLRTTAPGPSTAPRRCAAW